MVHDGLRLAAAVGAAGLAGTVYGMTPAGKIVEDWNKAKGQPLGEFPKGLQKELALSAAGLVGLAALYLKVGDDRVETVGRLASKAALSTLVMGLLDVPHSLFEQRDLKCYFVHRGADFLTLFTIGLVYSNLR